MFLGIPICLAVLLLSEIKCIHAEEISSSNKVAVSNSVTGYFDFATVGVANFGPERLGNLRSNYPPRSLLPLGNQNTEHIKQKGNHEVNFNRNNKDKSVPKERLFQLDYQNNDKHNRDTRPRGVLNPLSYNGYQENHVLTRSINEDKYIGEFDDDQNLNVELGEEFIKRKEYLAQGIRKSQEVRSRMNSYNNYRTTARDIDDSDNLPIPKIQYTIELDPLPYKPNVSKKYYLSTENPFVPEPIVSLHYQDDHSVYNKPFVNDNSKNDDSKAGILGKPVVIPLESTTTSYHSFEESTTEAIQKFCVQDCEVNSNYDPVCGSDGITYFNPMKFECARRCGIDIYVVMKGRCE